MGVENEGPGSVFLNKGYAQPKRTIWPENKALNLSASLGNEKNEHNYFRNCNNTYFVQGGQNGAKPGTRDGRSKDKLLTGLKRAAQTSKRKPSKPQVLASVHPLTGPHKFRNRSKSKEEFVLTEGNHSNLLANWVTMPKRSKRIE